MSNDSTPARGYALVLTAAALWGTLGLFYKVLIDRFGLTPLTVASYRSLLAGLILLAVLALRKPRLLAVNRHDLPLLVAYGVFGVAGFFIAYAYAIDLVGVAVAAVLLYTAPAWVGLIAWRWLGEEMHRRLLMALGLTLVGSVLVAGLYDVSHLRLNGLGVLAGLAAGLGYGLWSVFNKIAVARYSAWTVQTYALLIGAGCFLLLAPAGQLLGPLALPSSWPWLLAMAVIPTLGGALTYSLGVRWVPVSVASVVATLEPVIAGALAYLLLGERLALLQIAGGAAIISAVLLLRPPVSPGSDVFEPNSECTQNPNRP
ncbi:DMT family transporter [Candidatus Amarolinea dominans]|uniref:DMT family transporter n=1 Tax=Candidatus Amarolinea dominans TaxID=3140696 RepID=UPI001DF2F549|nr:EamA family transporter [Anaerolineae bacterium]MBK7204315.1 EamA family transporter [Anaerolineae bacterium]